MAICYIQLYHFVSDLELERSVLDYLENVSEKVGGIYCIPHLTLQSTIKFKEEVISTQHIFNEIKRMFQMWICSMSDIRRKPGPSTVLSPINQCEM